MVIKRHKKSLPDDRIFLGRISKPHALQGEVKFQAFQSDPKLLEAIVHVHADNPEMSLEVEYVRGSNKNPIVKFKSVNDRTGSDQLIGAKLWVMPDALPKLDSDEFIYESDIVDCAVQTVDGTELGIVVRVLETGTFDVMEVRDSLGNEWLIPVNQDVIQSISRDEGLLVVDPPDGLFESQRD